MDENDTFLYSFSFSSHSFNGCTGWEAQQKYDAYKWINSIWKYVISSINTHLWIILKVFDSKVYISYMSLLKEMIVRVNLTKKIDNFREWIIIRVGRCLGWNVTTTCWRNSVVSISRVVHVNDSVQSFSEDVFKLKIST